MKKLSILFLLSFISILSFSQGIGKAELKILQQKEDSLKDY